MRTGAHALLMAADPTKRRILQEMVEHPLGAGPGQEYRVTPGGKEVLFVGFVTQRWLQSAPQGPLPFGSHEAELAVCAMAAGWTATVMHVLARGPHSFDELHAAVGCLSREAVKRHLSAMRRAGQVEALAGADGQPIYAATEWLRAGIAPLIASARLERRVPTEGMAPIDALDVEAGFLCSLSLVELPRELSGSCRLGLRLEENESSCLTGVTARVEQGRIVSCEAGLDQKVGTWAAGTASGWLDTVIDPDAKQVQTGGDRWLAHALVNGLHKTLFGVPVRR
jgi:DNA-binding HxlR family transcriptional regulator